MKTGAASAVFVLCAGLAAAQDTGGLDAELTFSQGLTYSDDDGTYGRTDLGFGLTSTTRTQSFEFSVGTALNQDIDDGFTTSIVNPRAALAYGVESRQTRVTTSLSFRQSDADDVFTDPSGATNALVFDDGTREDINADFDVTFGREARFGGTVSLGYDETGYTDTASPDLIDTINTSASLSLRFEIDERITTTLGYSHADTDRATGRDTRTGSLTAGAQLAITPALDATLSIGQSRISVTDAGVTTVEDGLTYALGLTQTRSGGTLQYNLDSRLSEAGRRTTASIGTTFETRRGALSTTLGLTEGTDNALRPLLTLGYRQDLPRGSYSIALNQSFTTDADGDEALNSRLQLGWQQDLNRAARLSSDLTYQITDTLGADTDSSRLELGLQYSHDLTEDWSVKTRYSHAIIDEDGATTTRENEVFIGLETAIGWRP